MKRKCDEMREKVLDYAQLFYVYIFHTTKDNNQKKKNMSSNKTKKTEREKKFLLRVRDDKEKNEK